MRHQRGPYQLRVFDDIADADPQAWDSLLNPGDLQAQHWFVKTCQDAALDGVVFRHVMVYREAELVSIACLSAMKVNIELLAPVAVRGAVARIRRWLPAFLQLRVLFCGLPVSFGQSCLRFKENADCAQILEVLLAHISDEAASLEADLICLKEFPPGSPPSGDLLGKHGYLRVSSLPACSMDIHWDGIEEYLSSMRAGYRRQALASLRVRRHVGLDIRVVEDFADECERIYGLYEQVMRRAAHSLEHLNLRFFENLNAYAGSQSRAILIEKNRRLLAAAVLLCSKRTCTFLLAGIDYAVNRPNQAYLNLLVEVVFEAIRSQSSFLVLGQTSYAAKQRLGGTTSPLYLYLRATTPVKHALLAKSARFLFPSPDIKSRHVFKTPNSDAAPS